MMKNRSWGPRFIVALWSLLEIYDNYVAKLSVVLIKYSIKTVAIRTKISSAVFCIIEASFCLCFFYLNGQRRQVYGIGRCHVWFYRLLFELNRSVQNGQKAWTGLYSTYCVLGFFKLRTRLVFALFLWGVIWY